MTRGVASNFLREYGYGNSPAGSRDRAPWGLGAKPQMLETNMDIDFTETQLKTQNKTNT